MEKPQIILRENEGSKGIFYLVFVVLAAVFLLGILNYLNILPLSNLYPKYLSWLPRQIEQKQNIPNNQSRTRPSPSFSSEKYAKFVLINFLPQVLKPSLVPILSNVSIKPYSVVDDTWNASWKESPISANVIYTISQDTKKLESINIYVTEESDAEASPSLAQTLTSKIYSTTPKGAWGCKPFSSGNYCENFWQESNESKRGVGIIHANKQPQDRKLKAVVLCQYNKDSQYFSWKSCEAEFSQTGILTNL